MYRVSQCEVETRFLALNPYRERKLVDTPWSSANEHRTWIQQLSKLKHCVKTKNVAGYENWSLKCIAVIGKFRILKVHNIHNGLCYRPGTWYSWQLLGKFINELKSMNCCACRWRLKTLLSKKLSNISSCILKWEEIFHSKLQIFRTRMKDNFPGLIMKINANILSYIGHQI